MIQAIPLGEFVCLRTGTTRAVVLFEPENPAEGPGLYLSDVAELLVPTDSGLHLESTDGKLLLKPSRKLLHC